MDPDSIFSFPEIPDDTKIDLQSAAALHLAETSEFSKGNCCSLLGLYRVVFFSIPIFYL